MKNVAKTFISLKKALLCTVICIIVLSASGGTLLYADSVVSSNPNSSNNNVKEQLVSYSFESANNESSNNMSGYIDETLCSQESVCPDDVLSSSESTCLDDDTFYPNESSKQDPEERAVIQDSSLLVPPVCFLQNLFLNGVGNSGTTVIAIDPGHGLDPETGRYDPGAICYNLDEACANRWIADACAARLAQYGNLHVMVVPQYRSVTKRVEWAHEQGATVFVSLHNNSAGSGGGTTAHGFEIYIPNDSSFNYGAHLTGSNLARNIADNLGSIGRYFRGIKTRDATDGETYIDGHIADYYSANYTARINNMCGIIVEHAFIDNYDENAFIREQQNCDTIGRLDAEAIAKTFGGIIIDRSDAERYIERLYRCALNRLPDPEGFDCNVDALMKGQSAASMADCFFNSEEFKGISQSTAEKVSRVYNAILDRQPDETGKTYYTSYLDAHMSISSVIGCISCSQEFNNKCSEWRISSEPLIPTQARDKNYSITSYANRLYTVILNREPDIDGLNSNCQSLINGEGAALMTDFFINSPEYSSYQHSSSDIVNHVYLAMLDRQPDKAGFDHWLAHLDAQMTASAVVAGISGSPEFLDRCSEWGVTPGTIPLTQPRDKNFGVTSYVERLYEYVLGRKGDVGGLNTYCQSILNGSDAVSIAWIFYSSLEFSDQHNSNDVVVRKSYLALLRRDADPGGYSDWLNQLNAGLSLHNFISCFTECPEFEDRCAEYGIEKGSLPRENDPQPVSNHSIMGLCPTTYISAMANYYAAAVGEGTYPAYPECPTIVGFAQTICEEASAEGVRADVVFCQCMKETGWLKYGGDVRSDQRNFCGLKTADGTGFSTFESVRMGVRAHVQHLKAYGSTAPLVNECVDPRFKYVKRGIAPNVEDLNGKWAVPGIGYGEHILTMCDILKQYL